MIDQDAIFAFLKKNGAIQAVKHIGPTGIETEMDAFITTMRYDSVRKWGLTGRNFMITVPVPVNPLPKVEDVIEMPDIISGTGNMRVVIKFVDGWIDRGAYKILNLGASAGTEMPYIVAGVPE